MMASIYVSGDEAAYTETVPVLEGFTANNFYCGEVGNGSRMKLLANYLVHVHVTAAAECMVMGQKAGLDPKLIHTVLKEGAGGSKMFDIRGLVAAGVNRCHHLGQHRRRRTNRLRSYGWKYCREPA